jgi:hypothetical protein
MSDKEIGQDYPEPPYRTFDAYGRDVTPPDVLVKLQDRARADAGNDPEMLPPVEKIRYAEQLMRREHRVLGPDYLFWGNLADYLNVAANIPERTNNKERDWREFNRAQDMATGYIRMSQSGE